MAVSAASGRTRRGPAPNRAPHSGHVQDASLARTRGDAVPTTSNGSARRTASRGQTASQRPQKMQRPGFHTISATSRSALDSRAAVGQLRTQAQQPSQRFLSIVTASALTFLQSN
jgi:hypothetical protein